jgi:hypothetical protein
MMNPTMSSDHPREHHRPNGPIATAANAGIGTTALSGESRTETAAAPNQPQQLTGLGLGLVRFPCTGISAVPRSRLRS